MRLSLDMGLGSVVTLNQGVGYTFLNAEASALVARFSTQPTNARKALIDTMVGALKTAGVWSKLDTLHVMAAADSQAARQNWKADQFNLTAVSGPAFAADRGYTGDAAAAYLATGYQLGISGQSLQDSNYLMVWSRTESVSSVSELANTNNSIGLRSATEQFGVRNMVTSPSTDALATSVGMFSSARNGAATWRKSRNGVLVSGKTTASTTPAAFEMYLLGRNNNGALATPSGRQLAASAMGGYLTEPEGLALYNALNTYLQAVGAA